MVTRRGAALLAALAALTMAFAPPARSTEVPDHYELREFNLPEATHRRLTRLWIEQLQHRKPKDGWVSLRTDLTDEMLDLLGLPPREVLSKMRFPQPTIVDRRGRTQTVALDPADHRLDPVAGAGWFGIRPGAWLLVNGEVLSWCSMAHVYGAPGAYDISTAGHCAPRGTTATIVAAFGDHNGVAGPVLLDFGKFAVSHDDGPGRDWALIDIYRRHQDLVTPTMAFWGGPRGMYRSRGSVAMVRPTRSVNPDPKLAQVVVHYGHGFGAGTGGTPRAGAAIHWGRRAFKVFGALSFGDSGSGINTVGGDKPGATMEAAGIFTHFALPWVDLQSDGLGTMGGTRATQVPRRLAEGQIVPYPVPVEDAP